MSFRNFLRALTVIACFSVPLMSLASEWLVLGDPPKVPAHTLGMPVGASRKDVTGGFSVDTSSREQVRSFFNTVYRASEGLAIDTTADVGNCAAGTNSALYQDAVARRINWFRAMAGIPAAVSLSAAYSTNDQAAAVMMAANDTLEHDPPPTWSCYTSSGALAASNSNLALGTSGADAITGYIWDPGANNTEVGHRRWILYPQTQTMGTGDVPPQDGFLAANATWVFDSHVSGPRPPTTNPFVAWPPPGFVPYSLVFPQWSFALSNADLSAATVTMQSNGVSVPVSLQPYQTGFGENTVVWVPMGLDATSDNTIFPFDGADTDYSIIVTNINVGGKMIGFSYTTTLFDPSVPGGDYIATTVGGPAHPSVNTSNLYTCAAPDNPNVTGYQWIVSQSLSGDLFDGAEGGLVNFTATTTPGYSPVTNGHSASGKYSFYLAQPSTNGADPSDQTLQLDSVLLPTTNTEVSFESFLGYATTNQIAEVQLSVDDGETWQNVYAQTGTGAPQSSFDEQTLSLANYAGTPVLLRFDYHYLPPGDYYYQTSVDPPVGWFIDDILITNALRLISVSTNLTSSTNFVFTPNLPGDFALQAQPVLFSEFPLQAGPVTEVAAVQNIAPVIVLGDPLVSNGQVQLTFTAGGASGATFHLLQTDQLGSGWSTNTSAILTTNAASGSYTFTASAGAAQRFYRVQTP